MRFRRHGGITTMRSLTVTAAMASFACISACSTPTEASLSREVQRLIKVGDGLSAAEARLRAAGFECGESYLAGVDGHICDRTAAGAFVSGCLERVDIAFNRDHLNVSRIHVEHPTCACL